MATYRYSTVNGKCLVELPGLAGNLTDEDARSSDFQIAEQIGSIGLKPNSTGKKNLRIYFPLGYDHEVNPALDTVILAGVTIAAGSQTASQLATSLRSSSVFLSSVGVDNEPTTSVLSNQSKNNSEVLQSIINNEFALLDGQNSDTNGFNGSYETDGTPVVVKNTLSKTLYQIVPTGWSAIVYSITLSAVSECRFSGFISTGNLATTKAGVSQLSNINIGPNGGNVVINFNGGIRLYELGRVQFDVYSRSTKYSQPSIFVEAKMIANDPDVNAPLVIASIGDSISHPGTIGSTSNIFYGDTHFMGRIKTSLKAVNINVRKRYMGFNSATCTDNAVDVQSGRLDYGVFPDLLICNPMVNDAISIGAVGSNPNYQPNYEKILDWAFSKNPNISIIVMGSTTTDRTGSANIPAYKTLVQAMIAQPKYASKVASNQLKYYDGATGLTANNTNFVEQSAGQYLHPNGTGHGIIAAGLYPVVQTTKLYLDNV